MFLFLLLVSGFVQFVAAKEVYLYWNVTWVTAAPDGFERRVIGINGQWPCPQIDLTVGDRLIVDVENGLEDQSTAIHWHGFRQHMSGTMDGASWVTQCPVAPGQVIRYDFEVDQAGTYWYHSHNLGQYPDGLRGAIIVHERTPSLEYDEEFTITLSDWHHQEMPELLDYYLSEENFANTGGEEPIPDSILINDAINPIFKVEPNKTYLVRIICLGNWPGHAFLFDEHEMTVVEVDGVFVDPYPVGQRHVRLATGQRMSVLIRTKSDASRNYAFWNTADINMMFKYWNKTVPSDYNPNATAWLVYDEAKPLPPPPTIYKFDFVDDLDFIPADHEPLLEPADHQIILDTANSSSNGVLRYTINDQIYMPQSVPSLYTALTAWPKYYRSDPRVYGNVNPYVINYGDVVEIVINNYHGNLHPWHLHGHQFQVLQRTEVNGGYFEGYFQNVSATPMRRDTIMVQNYGHVVIRFRADNPGIWLLHCHIEWHTESGLIATIIEAPDHLENLYRPRDHLRVCAAYPAPMSGNAAGNVGLNLEGQNDMVIPGDSGATYPPPVYT